jgi:CheY-like chemotaxis protein/nitrogen-specific signal transduction histidine kinase
MRNVKSAKAAASRRKTAKAKRPRRTSSRAGATELALASLAHEIRTPLNGILAMSELIAAADLPAREREWAAQVKSAAEHLAHLSTLVVDGVRAEKRGLVLRGEPFRLRTLAEAVGATLAARAETKGLAADVAIAIDLPDEVIGDAVRLRAALENLADNAVKFTERGRVAMTVSAAPASRKRHTVAFGFTDSGIGLSKREIARLFRPFAQANGVARRYGGAGLGLVFVRRLARAMGGDLTVTSAPGEGSAFCLSVTVEIAPKKSAQRNRTAKTAATKALRVLCAEDNPYARIVLKTVLNELGHAVDFAGSGEAAVAAVERGAHDLVLMDVTLPGMDGLAATRAIRALNGAGARVPIIGISGRSEPRDRDAALAAGMSAFMAKPVSPAALAEAIAALVA